jgi:UDP-N-acetylglucosamine 2-epimerase (non-hydrolysing)
VSAARAERFRVATVIGTRPEAIKLAPVVHELNRRNTVFEQTVIATAQHRELLDQVLDTFGVVPDVDLDLMEANQALAGFASRSLQALADAFDELDPHAVLVQGDTTTVMTASLAAFYRQALVGHVEAGLRSFDRRNPFPEEINRRLAGCVADLHFAPTKQARRNLLAEGVPPDTIAVTGNTVVDALQSLPDDGAFSNPALAQVDFAGRSVVLVTAHRRESHGAPLRSICRALAGITARFEGRVEIVFPVHPSPHVRSVVDEELMGIGGIHLVDPLDYSDLLRVMRRCRLILTDSGGIQEEAPSFAKPVLVLREVTERPELIESGLGKLVGTSAETILDEASRLLTDERAYRAMTHRPNPFGDGRAAIRIADALEAALLRRGLDPEPALVSVP